MKSKISEYNVTLTSIQGTKEKTRHTMMPIQDIVKISTVVQNEIQRQYNTWVVALKEKPKQKESNPNKLCSGVTIFLLTMRISCICSHQ